MFQEHEYLHTNNAPHQCKLCGKRFSKKYLLQSHMYIHEGVIHKCSVCGSEYNNFLSYKQHVKRHLNNTFKGFWCNYCQTHLPSKEEYETHEATHHPDTPTTTTTTVPLTPEQPVGTSQKGE